MIMSVLEHQTIYQSSDSFELNLPLIDSLKAYHKDGTFPLIKDPNRHKKASIVGMFVLRPSMASWTTSILNEYSQPHDELFEIPGWAYNVQGLDGGWMISNRNALDAYRLALQYGISDAVMVGSRTVSEEGCNQEFNDGSAKLGYLWQSYEVCKWPSLFDTDAKLVLKIEEQRMLLQNLGHLSARRYPAQIFVTYSGLHYPERGFLNGQTRDFLEARAFCEKHPDGSEIEVYIVSSTNGCREIRKRSKNIPHLCNRIDDILIELSPSDRPDDIELERLPELLYVKYDMRVINNDGGQKLMKKCYEAGIMSQFNLTLCRNQSLKEVVMNHIESGGKPLAPPHLMTNFEDKVDIFFDTVSEAEENSSSALAVSRVCTGIPLSFVPVMVIGGCQKDEVAVITFDTHNATAF